MRADRGAFLRRCGIKRRSVVLSSCDGLAGGRLFAPFPLSCTAPRVINDPGMGLYNFKKRFAPYVRDGSKRHTIRAKRKHPDKPGDTVHLYTGLRTKHTELLGRSICVRVEDIRITIDRQIYIDGVLLSDSEKNALAFCDGFRSRGVAHAFDEMMEFWEGRSFPFIGDVIHWTKQLVRVEADLVRSQELRK
jgi:hypothetical protein